MLKYIFVFITIAHGLIHLIGFAKAFQFANITQLSKKISKPVGIIWLAASLLFFISIFLFLTQQNSWWMICISAIVVSQLLILFNWKDAKFGSTANLLILFYLIYFSTTIGEMLK